MKAYFSKIETIIDLHERGFTEDFELIGNDLLWIQQKIFLRPDNFYITEVHRFLDLSGGESIVFGVIANGCCLKGILLNHYKSYTSKMPPIFNRKLIQFDLNYLSQVDDYVEVTFSVN